MATAKSFPRKVWDTLSAVDVSGVTEQKNNLSYISWANAWSALMDHYPESHFQLLEPEIHVDNTVTVRTSLTIVDGEDSYQRMMWLPVMNYANKPIVGPGARDINDNTMRCLVKNIALFGLGIGLYRGEVTPEKHERHVNHDPAPPKATPEQKQELRDLWDYIGTRYQSWCRENADSMTEAHAESILQEARKRYAKEAAPNAQEQGLEFDESTGEVK